MLVQKTLMNEVTNLNSIIIGNRIPKDFFVTSGVGESDITIHAGSYHLALRNAGIEPYNIMTYSSTLPSVANKLDSKPKNLVHGSVMETIMACASSEKGKRATAGLIFGWIYSKINGNKTGGFVCEYNGNLSEEEACESLKASLNELYVNGYEEDYELRDVELLTKSIIPKKNFGTVLIALCFVNHLYPIPDIGDS